MNDCNVYLVDNGDYWKACWRDVGGKLHSKSLGSKEKRSKRQATVLCNRLSSEIRVNPAMRNLGRAPTLHYWIQLYLKERTDLAKGTKMLHKKTAEYLIEYFGGLRRIDRIDRSETANWRIFMSGKEVAEATVCGHVRNAKTIFKRAVDRDLSPMNPFDRLKGTAPKPNKDWHLVTREEFAQLGDACPDSSWRAMLGLCRLAGLRRAEALALPWSCVDWDKRRLRVHDQKRSKMSRGAVHRVVPIDKDLYSLLLDALECADEGSNRVWSRGHQRSGNLHRDLLKIISRANIEPWGGPFQTLRKSCETEWASQFPQHVVSEWIGHDITVSQNHYLKVSDDMYEKLSNLSVSKNVSKPQKQGNGC